MKRIFLMLPILLVIVVLFIKVVRNQAIETNRKFEVYLKSLHVEITGNVSAKNIDHGV
jgi:regulatory protein YycI of two-component signal transduction system YycFG